MNIMIVCIYNEEHCLNHFNQYLRGEYNEQNKKVTET